MVGSSKRCLLGVRPTGAHADILLSPPGDLTGQVVLNGTGLSVVEDYRTLPAHTIPEELDDEVNGASGKGMKVYAHETGMFTQGAVSSGLELLLKSDSVASGVVCPTTSVTLDQYQADLAATRTQWIEDES